MYLPAKRTALSSASRIKNKFKRIKMTRFRDCRCVIYAKKDGWPYRGFPLFLVLCPFLSWCPILALVKNGPTTLCALTLVCNRPRGTYWDSGDLPPLTFGMNLLTLFQSGSADIAHHKDLSHMIRKCSARPVHRYKSEVGEGTHSWKWKIFLFNLTLSSFEFRNSRKIAATKFSRVTPLHCNREV